MPTSDKPSGRTPPTASGVNSELNRLTQRVDELRRMGAISRRITLILVVIVLAEFGIFSYFTLHHVQSNFNQADLQKAVAERVPQVTPVLTSHLQTVVKDTLPIYRTQATERFQKVGPEVARDALSRLEKLPHENGEELNRQLQVALQGALTRLDPDVKKSFPSLSDEQRASILHQEFLGAVDKENEAIAHHLDGMADGELQNMKQVLEKFDVPADTSPTARKSREREFLHALVDVMMDSDETLKPNAAGSPTTQPAMKTASAAAPTTSVSVALPAVSH